MDLFSSNNNNREEMPSRGAHVTLGPPHHAVAVEVCAAVETLEYAYHGAGCGDVASMQEAADVLVNKIYAELADAASRNDHGPALQKVIQKLLMHGAVSLDSASGGRDTIAFVERRKLADAGAMSIAASVDAVGGVGGTLPKVAAPVSAEVAKITHLAQMVSDIGADVRTAADPAGDMVQRAEAAHRARAYLLAAAELPGDAGWEVAKEMLWVLGGWSLGGGDDDDDEHDEHTEGDALLGPCATLATMLGQRS